MQTATPPRLVRGDFPHLCPGDACAVCAYLAARALRVHDNARLTASEIAGYKEFDRRDRPRRSA